jgi:1-hydroxycarotenoid 3,4-desaturase
MHRVALALESLARERGVVFRYTSCVTRLNAQRGRVNGVELESGETLPADAVVFNGDISALADGAFGPLARSAARGTPPRQRGLSAITWCMTAPTTGFSLEHHNVFFGEDYAAEFRAIFEDRRVTEDPTVYVCAQDRGAAAQRALVGGEAERLLVLVNAPADSDLTGPHLDSIEARSFGLMRESGLTISRAPGDAIITGPRDFAALFPHSGGSLYGRANHGALGSFQRSGSRSALPGLYLAGGTVHPGPGIPMVTLSGRLAAASVLADQR